MIPTPWNLTEKFELITEQWSPKILAEIDDYQFKLAKLEGDFVWHSHPETDEIFFIVSGELQIDFRDGSVTLKAGEMLQVPRGVEHKPYAAEECHVMILVKAGTVNTGDAPENSRTADPDARL